MSDNKKYFDPRSMPDYMYTFYAPPPTSELQSFQNEGIAPFGYPLDYVPSYMKLQTDGMSETENLYNLKVDATPINPDQLGSEPLQYVVSGGPNVQGFHQHFIDPTKITGHIYSDSGAMPGFTIKPLNTCTKKPEKNDYGDEELPNDLANPEDNEQAYINIYNTDPNSKNAQFHVDKKDGFLQEHLRQLSNKVSVMSVDEDERSRIYNWVIPADGNNKDRSDEDDEEQKEADNKMSANRWFNIFGFMKPNHSSVYNKFGSFFRKSSTRTNDTEDIDSLDVNEGPHVITTANDDDLQLPDELKPTVVYGGIQHGSPEFAGTKTPLDYKLHAIEIHQYIPLPGKEDAWIIANNIDPCTKPLYGPMPLPFDPSNSGMVAPTFQPTMSNHLTPTLSPEILRMFNQEIPSVSS